MRVLNAWTTLPAVAVAALAATAALAGLPRDLGRAALAAGDGWASADTGTTGGAAASADRVYVVTNRRELVAALNDGGYPPPSTTPSNAPKIIYVDRTIDGNLLPAGGWDASRSCTRSATSSRWTRTSPRTS